MSVIAILRQLAFRGYCPKLSTVKRPRLLSTTDTKFLRTVEDWLHSQSEILVLIRYSRAAGSKSFEFFRSFERLRERLKELTPETSVTVFRKRQLPLRGIVGVAARN